MNEKFVVTEKLVIGVCLLFAAFAIAVAASLVVNPSIRRELFQTALIVLALSIGLSVLGGLDWLVSPRSSDSVANELYKLAHLRDRGILTEAEFQSQKRKLLGEPSDEIQSDSDHITTIADRRSVKN